eukprot:Phypoly_transcript_14136.p1 GENE.Phypoly_transcript_14136~~Phypoly_transcript_14136.p1  ORF type:complete len:282 (+),score=25.85 Phypoly_transcript_14136:110-955(+)
MELNHIGQHCSEPSCKVLDFLPFQCTSCKRTFCLEHRSLTAHKCHASDFYVPACPLCGQVVKVAQGEDPNHKVDQHISQGCPKEASTSHPAHAHQCSKPKCNKIEVMPVVCSSCRKNFCLKHRMPQDHDCIVEERKKQRREHMRTTAEKGKYNSALQAAAAKQNPTALKVAMMKMKLHSEGDDKIPHERRFYLEVVYPIESGVNPKMMFFDSNYSIGKVLDLIAAAGKIENNNNKVTSEKLHVILLKTGVPLPNDGTLGKIDNLNSGDSVLLGTLNALAQS